MRVGCIITLTAGKYSCKYMVISYLIDHFVLKRCVLAKSKADHNRFNNEIIFHVGANYMIESPKQ